MSRGSNAVIEEDPWGAPAERYCPECGCRVAMYDQCVNVDLDTDMLPLAAPRVGLSSGVTTIRGHTQPGSPPSVRCQVVTIARQRQYTHEHMSREHGHNCVAKFFSKDSKYQHNTS